MGKFNLSEYEEVKDRLKTFYKRYPDGRVLTEIVTPITSLETIVFKATLYSTREDQDLDCPLSTGYAYEKDGDGCINKTSHVENCETSSIGRALANMTLHGDKRPSKEEMEKVERMSPKSSPKKEEELF